MSPRGCPRTEHAGRLTLADSVVTALVVTIVFLFLLMAIPRGREHARTATCQGRLARIGNALAVFDETQGALPVATVAGRLDQTENVGSPSPLRTVIDVLKLPDFSTFDDRDNPPKPQPDRVPGEQRLPDLICPSDRAATSPLHPAPTSYRACAGDDPAGSNGVFALGRGISLARVQEIDGLTYKAAYSERLVGDGGSLPNPENYRVVSLIPATPAELEGARSRGDAGGRWTISDFRYTLYNHAITPGARPSLVASDGKSAWMGASSSHEHGVHVLFCDGHVDAFRPTVDATLWRRLAHVELEPRE